jgi:hypothetical protein
MGEVNIQIVIRMVPTSFFKEILTILLLFKDTWIVVHFYSTCFYYHVILFVLWWKAIYIGPYLTTNRHAYNNLLTLIFVLHVLSPTKLISPSKQTRFLSCFKRVRKTTKSDCCLCHVCPSVRPHGTTLFSLNGFPWNLMLKHFSIICRENSSFLKIGEE